MIRGMVRDMARRMVWPVIGSVVMSVVIVPVVIAAQRRPNQLAIGKAFLIGGLSDGTLGWYGVQSFFHMSPPAHGGGKNATTHEPVIVGLEWKLMRYGTTAK